MLMLSISVKSLVVFTLLEQELGCEQNCENCAKNVDDNNREVKFTR